MEFSPDSAKQFLLSKLTEQASIDGIALDEIERRMFLFSESLPDYGVQEKFDEGYESRAYESKVRKLLHRSYARDKNHPEGKAPWMAALKALSREDFYGLVMVDQVKIPRPKMAQWIFLVRMFPFALTELLVLFAGFVLAFHPDALRLHLPDWFRLLLLPAFLLLFWYIGNVLGRIPAAKSVRRTETHQS